MKKYLMTGMAAIAFCAAFTSCSKDENLYDPKAIEEMEMAQNYEAYNQAFIATFGQVNPNQDWGFGSRARTRGENANANEWADPNKAYGGLIVPPPLTAKQIAVVKKYFQTHPNLGYQDPGWSNYFIQQVYKGHTDVPEGCATFVYLLQGDDLTMGRLPYQGKVHLLLRLSAAVARMVCRACRGS